MFILMRFDSQTIQSSLVFVRFRDFRFEEAIQEETRPLSASILHVNLVHSQLN